MTEAARLDVLWDMETSDPDDFLTLLFLLGHPRVNLRAVTIMPGTPDLLAATCAIDPSIGQWAEVHIYRERGEWGARPAPGSGTWIIIDYDRDRFLETLLAR